jgi:hypothetical protein
LTKTGEAFKSSLLRGSNSDFGIRGSSSVG